MTVGPKNPHLPVEAPTTVGGITRQKYADGELLQIEFTFGDSLNHVLSEVSDLGESGRDGGGPVLMDAFSDDGNLYLSFWVANE